jgi:hypothetical protein
LTSVNLKPHPWEGSGKFIQRCLLETQLTPEQIVEKVLANYPGRKTTVADVAWNRNQLKLAKKLETTTIDAGSMTVIKEAETTETTSDATTEIVAPEKSSRLYDLEGAMKQIMPGDEVVENALLYLTGLPDEDKPATISSHHIARYIKAHTKIDVIWHKNQWNGLRLPKRIKRLWAICSSSSFLKTPWHEFSMALWACADEVVFCSNDYKGPAHAFYLGRLREDARYVNLVTIERLLQLQPGELVNWNVLTYHPRELDLPYRQDFLYYGTVRPSRVKQFEKFFPGLGEHLTISATKTREGRWFKELCPLANIIGKSADITTELGCHVATMILEDPYSYRNFTCPPNRFYEALSVGTAMFFMPDSVPNFDKAGFDIRPFVVKGPEDAVTRLTEAEDVAKDQRRWHADYLGLLDQQFSQILESLDAKTLGRIGAPPNRKRYEDQVYKLIWMKGTEHASI